MSLADRQRVARLTRDGLKAAGLVALLVVGAYVMASANAVTGCAWLGWFSLVPLFLVIRLWRAVPAMLAGGLWGACLYAFSVAQPDAGVAPGFSSLLLLAATPAVYSYLAGRLTRRIGFNPFVLGVAWMGVELALTPSGLSAASASGARGDGTWIHWVSQGFGYVLAAFVIAMLNASLVSLLSGVRFSIPQASHYRILPADSGASFAPQSLLCLSLFAIRLSRPRAPPIPSS